MHLSRRGMISGGAMGIGAWVFAPDAASARPLRLRRRLVDAAAAEALEAHACPGIQISIAVAGDVSISRAYGMANIETRTATSERSVFRIASLTKQFTAAALVKLAAAGRVELNAPVARYLPFMERLQATSLLELMHHTAGLHSDESGVTTHSGAAPSQVALAEEIARQSQPFDFPPGTAWLYSNANYIVLGAVIEAVTATPFSQAMSELVCAPLGLTSTSVDHTGDVVAHRVNGYTPGDGADGPFANAALLEISDAGGAGSMRSTATDLCRWHAGLLGGQLLRPSDVALMMAPGRLRDGRVSGANRFSPEDARYGDVQYACGLLVSPTLDAHPSILHYGYINGFACALQTFLGPQVTMAVLCNGDVGPATPFRALRQIVTAAL
ncbi:MAG: beta-lactamase family protein [Hyphomonadaceae bacterium]|nr:beta-lactamase family protein [Hyphomonadaceae bacterium]